MGDLQLFGKGGRSFYIEKINRTDATGKVVPSKKLAFLAESTYSSERYIGNSPMQAAKRAFTRICQEMSGKEASIEFYCTFYIKETTDGSAEKSYSYNGSKEIDSEGKGITITVRVYRDPIKMKKPIMTIPENDPEKPLKVKIITVRDRALAARKRSKSTEVFE